MSLFGRLKQMFSEALEQRCLIDCEEHGPQPWVAACDCVLAGVAQPVVDGICAAHVGELDIFQTCSVCVVGVTSVLTDVSGASTHDG